MNEDTKVRQDQQDVEQPETTDASAAPMFGLALPRKRFGPPAAGTTERPWPSDIR